MTNKTQKTYYIVYFEIIYNTISNLKGSIINTNLSKTISNLKSSIINTNLSKKELLENFLKNSHPLTMLYHAK